MKKLLAIIFLGLLFSGSAYAKIDWKKRNLCENSKYKKLCSTILNKKLVGLNTIVNFKFNKGKIIALINLKKGENMSLLTDPDPSYVAKYSGEYLVYKNADGVFITEFAPASPMEHFICDSSNNCIDVISLQWSVEKKKDNPAEERNKLLISCLKDNRETSIKLKNTECEAYADGEAVDIGDDSGNPVWERPDWYSLNICKKKKIKECENVGKNLYLYNSIVKRDLKIGPVVGVVYLKKGQDRGTNQVRLAEKNSYYYLIDDMGDKNNLLTVLLVKEHSFK